MAIKTLLQMDTNGMFANTKIATDELIKLDNEIVAVNLGRNDIDAAPNGEKITIKDDGVWEWGGVLFKLENENRSIDKSGSETEFLCFNGNNNENKQLFMQGQSNATMDNITWNPTKNGYYCLDGSRALAIFSKKGRTYLKRDGHIQQNHIDG
jgi:Tfp pilus assembly protein FimT